MQLCFGPWTLDAERRQLLLEGVDVRGPEGVRFSHCFEHGISRECTTPCQNFVSDGAYEFSLRVVRPGDDAITPYVRTGNAWVRLLCEGVDAGATSTDRWAPATLAGRGEHCAALVDAQRFWGADQSDHRFDLPGVLVSRANLGGGRAVHVEDLESETEPIAAMIRYGP